MMDQAPNKHTTDKAANRSQSGETEVQSGGTENASN